MDESKCTWCGNPTIPGDRFELFERAGAREACFCRLEHIVPWTIRGAHWNPSESLPELNDRDECSFCGGSLPDTRIDLMRRRAGVVVDDAFCSIEHLASWAKSGGRYAKP